MNNDEEYIAFLEHMMGYIDDDKALAFLADAVDNHQYNIKYAERFLKRHAEMYGQELGIDKKWIAGKVVPRRTD